MQDNSPAATAGLKPGDLIVTLNDRAMQSVDDLHRALTEIQVGATFTMRLIRGRQLLSVEALAGELPDIQWCRSLRITEKKAPEYESSGAARE